jgi:hypothetical protein
MARLRFVGAHLARLSHIPTRPRPPRAQSLYELWSWESFEAQQAWKDSPEFNERIGRVKQHTEEFTPSVLEHVTAVE